MVIVHHFPDKGYKAVIWDYTVTFFLLFHVYALHIFCIGYESELTVIKLLGKWNLRHSGLTGDHGLENTKKDDPGAYVRKSSRCHHWGSTMQLVHVSWWRRTKATPSMKSLHDAADSGATSSASFPGFSILSFLGLFFTFSFTFSWLGYYLNPFGEKRRNLGRRRSMVCKYKEYPMPPHIVLHQIIPYCKNKHRSHSKPILLMEWAKSTDS